MLTVLPIVLPVFALIFAGWFARRSKALGAHATQEINRFVVYLALPALLFDIVANASWTEIWQPAFIASFGLAALLVFGMTVLVALFRRRPLADAAVDGLNASYANTGFMGFPLMLALFGPSSLAPTLTSTILTACVLFAIALVLMEVGTVAKGQSGVQAIFKVLLSLARNPLLLAPALGGACLALGITIPASAGSFLKLLGAAAPPCALVALGLFLADQARQQAEPLASPSLKMTVMLVGLKLLVQPALAWWLATQVFGLSGTIVHMVVVLSALSTGTGPFMVATLYGRDARMTARVILVSVLLSLFTLTAYLALTGYAG